MTFFKSNNSLSALVILLLGFFVTLFDDKKKKAIETNGEKESQSFLFTLSFRSAGLGKRQPLFAVGGESVQTKV